MKRGSAKPVHCAIYTRVSTDQGLEQDFNSLDAQYDASQAYIRSQAHAGWSLLRAKYEDGGFSGGNIDRPALRRLLDDVGAGKIDVIVVYKVDRLTRSLADFANELSSVCRFDPGGPAPGTGLESPETGSLKSRLSRPRPAAETAHPTPAVFKCNSSRRQERVWRA